MKKIDPTKLPKILGTPWELAETYNGTDVFRASPPIGELQLYNSGGVRTPVWRVAWSRGRKITSVQLSCEIAPEMAIAAAEAVLGQLIATCIAMHGPLAATTPTTGARSPDYYEGARDAVRIAAGSVRHVEGGAHGQRCSPQEREVLTGLAQGFDVQVGRYEALRIEAEGASHGEPPVKPRAH